jgi:hypothetical protein
MPCLSGRFTPNAGIILSLACLPPRDSIPASNATPSFFSSLLDTGASDTCVSPKVAQTLGIQPIGLIPMSSASHVNVPTNTYLIDLGIVFGDTIFWQNDTQVLEFQPVTGSPYEMLLGRDIICQGTLAVSFDGHWTFAI